MANIPPTGLQDLATVFQSYTGKVPYVSGRAMMVGPNPGADCSGALNWILAVRFQMTLPGGIKNFNGSWHGPVVVSYAAWKAAVTVSTPAVDDLVIWPGIGPAGHIGVYTGGGQFVSENGGGNVSTGPVATGGPAGVPVMYRRILGMGNVPAGTPGCPLTAAAMVAAAFTVGRMAWKKKF